MNKGDLFRWYDCLDGDVFVKDTDIKDRGKSIFMRLINDLTTFIQNIQRKRKGLPPIKGRDHTELFLWSDSVLETHSSQSGKGARTQNMLHWLVQEDYPKGILLRRHKRITPEEKVAMQSMIAKDRGLPYATRDGILDGLKLDYNNIKPYAVPEDELIHRGIYCSESTLKWSLFQKWAGLWPDPLVLFLLNNGYYIAFEGDTSTWIDN